MLIGVCVLLLILSSSGLISLFVSLMTGKRELGFHEFFIILGLIVVMVCAAAQIDRQGMDPRVTISPGDTKAVTISIVTEGKTNVLHFNQ